MFTGALIWKKWKNRRISRHRRKSCTSVRVIGELQLSRQKQITHGKGKPSTAKANRSRQKRIHSRQKQFYPAEYTRLVWFVYFYWKFCTGFGTPLLTFSTISTESRSLRKSIDSRLKCGTYTHWRGKFKSRHELNSQNSTIQLWEKISIDLQTNIGSKKTVFE